MTNEYTFDNWEKDFELLMDKAKNNVISPTRVLHCLKAQAVGLEMALMDFHFYTKFEKDEENDK